MAALEAEIVTDLPSAITRIPALFGGLSPRQLIFIDTYLATGNATEAARKAGYSGDKDSLPVQAQQVLRSKKVRAEIQRRLGTSVADSQEVLERLTLHARGDLTDVLNPDGSFDLKLARKRGTSQLLKKLKVKTRYERDLEGNLQPVTEHEYEIHDPQAALVHLGKFHKLFADSQIEANLTDGDATKLAQALIPALMEEIKRKRALSLMPATDTDVNAAQNSSGEPG